ncbi:hypothetical protein LINPERPRIM_LOCUS33269, partial [Linum perenne]
EALSTHLKLLKLTPFSELSFHSPKSSNLSFTGVTIFLLQIWRRTGKLPVQSLLLFPLLFRPLKLSLVTV